MLNILNDGQLQLPILAVQLCDVQPYALAKMPAINLEVFDVLQYSSEKSLEAEKMYNLCGEREDSTSQA